MTRVALMLGSLSDKGLVRESGMLEVFEHVGLDYEAHVVSAHRNAEQLRNFCAKHPEIQIFIAAAALATALPGAIAGTTEMRKVVIGVPLDDYGIDSCVRMPPGVPVLTAGVGKAGLYNAAIAACQILAVADQSVALRLEDFLSSRTRSPQFDISFDAE